MATQVKREIVWLPSHEEIMIKHEKGNSLETCINIRGQSCAQLLECKIEKTEEIDIKQEPQETFEDEGSSSFDSEDINHPSLQIDNTSCKIEYQEKANYVDIDEQTGLNLKEPYYETKYFESNRYKEHTGYVGKRHNSKPFSCDLCDQKFTRRDALTSHIRIHTGENLFACDLCDKQFTRKGNLNSHRITHTGEKPFSCEFCQKQFTGKGTLNRHRRIHTGEKPYSCDLCDKQFTDNSKLISHRRTHTGEKPFSCDICTKQFIQQTNLTKHRRTHTGEKPFSCDLCDRHFTVKSALIYHRRTHTGEKPYSCDVCNQKFARRDALTSHSRVHNGGRSIVNSQIAEELPVICKLTFPI